MSFLWQHAIFVAATCRCDMYLQHGPSCPGTFMHSHRLSCALVEFEPAQIFLESRRLLLLFARSDDSWWELKANSYESQLYSLFGPGFRHVASEIICHSLSNECCLLPSGNGQMDFEEFVKLMVAKNQFSFNEREAKEAFRIFDRDCRGYVMSEELRQVFQTLEEKIPEHDINEMLQDQKHQFNRKISFDGN